MNKYIIDAGALIKHSILVPYKKINKILFKFAGRILHVAIEWLYSNERSPCVTLCVQYYRYRRHTIHVLDEYVLCALSRKLMHSVYIFDFYNGPPCSAAAAVAYNIRRQPFKRERECVCAACIFIKLASVQYLSKKSLKWCACECLCMCSTRCRLLFCTCPCP